MEYKLKDLVEIKYGKNQKNVKNSNGVYPILGTGGVMDFADDFLYDKPSVLIGRKGSIGKVKYIEKPFWTIDTLFYTVVKENLVLPKYLYYKLSQIDFNYYNEGTTIPSLRTETLYKISIDIPNIKTQKNVVKVLSNIDWKIELNQKIIANLEELSQTLFKRWFVDFEFPDENGNPYKSSGGEMIDSELGNIPRDWEVNELGNYVDIIKGLSYKGAFLDKQHERSDSFPLLSISNFNFISGFKSNKTKYYFGDYKERHLVNPGDILIAATDLTQDRKILGAPAIIPNLNKTMIFSLDVFKITETTIPKYVLYFLLQSAKYREFVEGSATGTTVIRIAKNVILKVPIVIDKDISLKFDDLIKPYMEKIEHLSQENQKLTQLRDTLLPKLMSGEIEIPDHIEVNEDELSI